MELQVMSGSRWHSFPEGQIRCACQVLEDANTSCGGYLTARVQLRCGLEDVVEVQDRPSSSVAPYPKGPDWTTYPKGPDWTIDSDSDEVDGTIGSEAVLEKKREV